jgi:hypothetical protein
VLPRCQYSPLAPLRPVPWPWLPPLHGQSLCCGVVPLSWGAITCVCHWTVRHAARPTPQTQPMPVWCTIDHCMRTLRADLLPGTASFFWQHAVAARHPGQCSGYVPFMYLILRQHPADLTQGLPLTIPCSPTDSTHSRLPAARPTWGDYWLQVWCPSTPQCWRRSSSGQRCCLRSCSAAGRQPPATPPPAQQRRRQACLLPCKRVTRRRKCWWAGGAAPHLQPRCSCTVSFFWWGCGTACREVGRLATSLCSEEAGTVCKAVLLCKPSCTSRLAAREGMVNECDRELSAVIKAE